MYKRICKWPQKSMNQWMNVGLTSQVFSTILYKSKNTDTYSIQLAAPVWIKMCLCFWVFVCQSNRQRKSWVPHCAEIPLADILMGSHLTLDKTGNVKRAQHTLIFSCTIILYSVSFNFDLFSLCFLYPLPYCLPSPIPPRFLLTAPCLSFLQQWWFMSVSWCTHRHTLHGSSKQFSTNGKLQYCMLKPSGAVDGPLAEIGIRKVVS